MNRRRSQVVVRLATFAAVGILAAFPAFGASPPVVPWARTATCGTGDSAFDGGVAFDPEGNLYAAGVIRSPDVVDFGNGITARDPKPDSWNAVLVKYSVSGEAQWARCVAGDARDSAFTDVALDSAGNVFVVGYIGKGTYDFGNGVTAVGHETYVPSGYAYRRAGNVILVKYDSSGNAQWARTISGSEQSSFYWVVVDSFANVYCGGNIGRSVFDFGDGVTVTAGPESDGSVVIAKYDSAGAVKWARTVPTGGGVNWRISLQSLTLDAWGNPYGAFSIERGKTFDFGNGVKVQSALAGSLLVKYDPDGNAQWAAAPLPFTRLNSVAVDAAGYVYAAGTINSNCTVQFGKGVSLRVSGKGDQVENAILVKYDLTGVAQWARSVVQASYNSWAQQVTTDAAGHVYVAGWIERNEVLGFGDGITVRGPYWGASNARDDAGKNAYFARYSPEGTVQWAQSVTSSASNTYFFELAIDSTGHPCVAGFFEGGTVEFAPGVTVTATGQWCNALLIKY
jgi:hypothetical protein